MDLWWNKSCLWDSSWPSEQFYGNVRVKGIRKWSTREIFDSIIFKFKEGFENTHFKAKKIAKNFKGALSGLRQVLVTESPLKMTKNIRDSLFFIITKKICVKSFLNQTYQTLFLTKKFLIKNEYLTYRHFVNSHCLPKADFGSP